MNVSDARASSVRLAGLEEGVRKKKFGRESYAGVRAFKQSCVLPFLDRRHLGSTRQPTPR